MSERGFENALIEHGERVGMTDRVETGDRSRPYSRELTNYPSGQERPRIAIHGRWALRFLS